LLHIGLLQTKSPGVTEVGRLCRLYPKASVRLPVKVLQSHTRCGTWDLHTIKSFSLVCYGVWYAYVYDVQYGIVVSFFFSVVMVQGRR